MKVVEAEKDKLPTVMAYGYVRAEEPDEEAIRLWRKAIGAWCNANAWRLAEIFCDRGVSGDVIARIGFTALLDALELPDAAVVVVVDLDHLSPDAMVRQGLVGKIGRMGARVVEVGVGKRSAC